MARKKKIEFLMNTDWMFEKPIDREHKEYKLADSEAFAPASSSQHLRYLIDYAVTPVFSLVYAFCLTIKERQIDSL